MKLKKIIVGIFATIGVASVLLGLVGIGYIMGTGTDLGTIISADRGASTGNVVSNIENPTENPTNTSESQDFVINEEDYFYDDSGKLQCTLELINFVKSFGAFSSLDNPQIIRIIESQDFKTLINTGTFLGDLQGYLSGRLSDHTMASWLVRSNLGDITDTQYENNDNIDSVVDNTTPSGTNPTATPIPTETPSSTDNNVTNDESKPQDSSIEVSEESKYTFTDLNKTMYATQAVNTRKGPSTDYEKVGSLTKGEQVTVIAQCNETDWFMIQDGADVYFVTSKYLSETPPATPTPAPTATPTPTTSQSTESTQTKYPTGSVVETITLTYPVDPDDSSKGFYTEEVTCSGTYVKPNIYGSNATFFIPDGLEESHDPIIITNSDEMIAWCEKYPTAEYGVITITQNGEEVKAYKLYPGGEIKTGASIEDIINIKWK